MNAKPLLLLALLVAGCATPGPLAGAPQDARSMSMAGGEAVGAASPTDPVQQAVDALLNPQLPQWPQESPLELPPLLANHWDFEDGAQGWTHGGEAGHSDPWAWGTPPVAPRYELALADRAWVEAGPSSAPSAPGAPLLPYATLAGDATRAVPQPVPLPFEFPFYGRGISVIYPATTGIIRLGVPHLPKDGALNPSPTTAGATCLWMDQDGRSVAQAAEPDFVAPLWSGQLAPNPLPASAASPSTMWVRSGVSGGLRFAVVEWKNFVKAGGPALDSAGLDFEAILVEDGRILFQYRLNSLPLAGSQGFTVLANSALVGLNANTDPLLEAAAGLAGLPYTTSDGFNVHCRDGSSEPIDPSKAYILRPAQAPPGKPAGANLLGTFGTQPMPRDTRAWLESPPIELRQDAVLTFWNWREFNAYPDGGLVSGAAVQVLSARDGWTPHPVPVATLPATSQCGAGAGPVPCASGQSGWRRDAVDLSGYAGQAVKLRFLALGNGDAAAGNPNHHPGWFIDDVEVHTDFVQIDGNLAVTGVQAPGSVHLGEDVAATATVKNTGSTPVEGATLAWSAASDNGTASGAIPLGRLGPQEAAHVAFTWTALASPYTLRVQVEAPGDPFPADDRFQPDPVVHVLRRLLPDGGDGAWTQKRTEYGASSPSHAWAWGPTPGWTLTAPATLSPNHYTLATPPVLASPAYGSLHLRFWMDLALAAGQERTDPQHATSAVLEASTDGENWSRLLPDPDAGLSYTAASCAYDHGPDGRSSPGPCWNQAVSGPVDVDLTRQADGQGPLDLIGTPFQLRFRFFAQPVAAGTEFPERASSWRIGSPSIEGEAFDHDAAALAIAFDPATPADPLPADYGPGEDAPIHATVGNLGRSAIPILPVEVRADGVLLATATFLDVAPGETRTLNATFHVPDGNGAPHLVTAASTLADPRPANDGRSRGVRASRVPGLALGTANPSFHAPAGAAVTVAWAVQSLGSTTVRNATLGVTVRDGSGAIVHAESGLPVAPAQGVKPYGSVAQEWTWQPPGPGEYRVEGTVALPGDWEPAGQRLDNAAQRRVFSAVPPRLLGGPADGAWEVGAVPRGPAVWQAWAWNATHQSRYGPKVPNYSWAPAAWVALDALNGTRQPVDGDDATGSIPLGCAPLLPGCASPKPFPFYPGLWPFIASGSGASALGFSTNGLLFLNVPPATAISASSLENHRSHQATCQLPAGKTSVFGHDAAFIAPLWDDLVIPTDPAQGGIYTAYAFLPGTTKTATVIEWRNARLASGGDPFTFEAILVEDGTILLQYQTPVPSPAAPVTAVEAFYANNGFIPGRLFSCGHPEDYGEGSTAYALTFGNETHEPQDARMWGTSFQDTYPASSDQLLRSGPLDLSHAQHPVLRFRHSREFSVGDGGRVVASTDAGLTWKALTPDGGYPDSVPALGGAAGYAGVDLAWSEASVDLASVKSPATLVAFEFASDRLLQATGWYVDDVTVQDGATVLASDTGDGHWLAPASASDWARGEATGLPPYPGSNATLWATGLAGPYSTNRVQALASPPVDLRQAADPILSFWSYVNTTRGPDKALVEVRNATSGWAPLDPAWYTSGGETGALGWRYVQVDLRHAAYERRDPARPWKGLKDAPSDLTGPGFQVRWTLDAATSPQRGLAVGDVSVSDVHPVWDAPARVDAKDADTLDVPLTLANRGADPDTFTLAAQDVPPGWDVSVAPAQVSLRPGEQASVVLHLTTPVGGHAGVHDLTLDARSAVDPFRRGRALLPVLLAPGPNPDLHVAAFTVADLFLDHGVQKVWTGQPHLVTAYVENLGTGPATGFTVSLYENSTGAERLVESQQPATILPGQTVLVGFRWTPRATDPLHLRVAIDLRGHPELDGGNNEAALDVVGAPGLFPDLRLEGLRLDPRAPRPGEPATASFRAANHGTQPIAGTVRYEALANAQDGLLATALPAGLPQGTGPYRLEFRANYDLEDGVDGVAVQALYPDGWRPVPVPGPVGRPASMAGPDVLTGSSQGEWRTVALDFAQPPQQVRLVARLDGGNQQPSHGFAVDAVAWRDAHGTLWSDDFESGAPAWTTSGFMRLLRAPAAPIGFAASGGGFAPGGAWGAGFGDFDSTAGYDRLFLPDASGACPGGACLVAVGALPPLAVGGMQAATFGWTPQGGAAQTLLVRLDPKGALDAASGGLPPEASVSLDGVAGAATWRLLDQVPAAPGGTAVLCLELTNEGPDTLRPALSAIAPFGWIARFDPLATDALPPGAAQVVTLRVELPAEALPGDHSIDLVLADGSDGGRAQHDAILLHVPLPDGPAPWTLHGIPAAVATDGVAGLIQVQGAAGDTTLTAGILRHPAGWLATVEPASLVVHPGETGYFRVRLQQTPAAPPGPFNLTAWVGDGGSERNVTLRFDLPALARLAVAAGPPQVQGQTVQVPATVANHGNQPATLLVLARVGDRVFFPAAGEAGSGNLTLAPGQSRALRIPLPRSAFGERAGGAYRVEAWANGQRMASAAGSVQLPAAVPLDAAVDEVAAVAGGLRVSVVYAAPPATEAGTVVGLDRAGKTLWEHPLPPGEPGTLAAFVQGNASATARIEVRTADGRPIPDSGWDAPQFAAPRPLAETHSVPAPSLLAPLLALLAACRRARSRTAPRPPARGSRVRLAWPVLLALLLVASPLPALQVGLPAQLAPVPAAPTVPPGAIAPGRLLGLPAGSPAPATLGWLIQYGHGPVTPEDLQRLAEVPGLRIVRAFQLVPAVWAAGPPAAAEEATRLPGVLSVRQDAPMAPDPATLAAQAQENLTQAVQDVRTAAQVAPPLLPADRTNLASLALKAEENETAYRGAWREEQGNLTGWTGRGVTVAIVDGGIDDHHAAFDGVDPGHVHAGFPEVRTDGPRVRARLNALSNLCTVPTCGDASLTGDLNRTALHRGPCPPSPSCGPATDPGGEEMSTVRPHATAMAGIVAGNPRPAVAGQAGLAPRGIAPQVSLVDVDVFAAGQQTVASAVAGLDAIAAYNQVYPATPIDIALLPLSVLAPPGAGDPTGTLDAGLIGQAIDALAHSADRSVLTIVPAGTGHAADGEPFLAAPATAPAALTVGAFDARQTACRGDDAPYPGDSASAQQQRQGLHKPEVVAPGVAVLAPVAGTLDLYQSLNGTDVAAANAAGVAALALQQMSETDFPAPFLPSAAILRDRLNRTSEARSHGWTPEWGFGALDAANATETSPVLPADLGETLLANASAAQVELPGLLTVAGRAWVNDTRASHLVRERAPGNRCRDGDTLPPQVWADGAPIPGQAVHVLLGGNGTSLELETAATNATGAFSAQVALGAGTIPGDYTLAVVARSDPSALSVEPRGGAALFPVLVQDRPRLTLDACFPQAPPTCLPDTPVLDAVPGAPPRFVRVHAERSGSVPLPGQALTLEWSGTATTDRTDEQAQTILPLPLGLPAGVHPLRVTTPATHLLLPGSATVDVTIRHPTNVTVDAAALPGALGANAAGLAVRASLVDAFDGGPLGNRTLVATLPDGHEVGRGVTGPGGWADLPVDRHALPAGAVDLVVRFAGGPFHVASSSLPVHLEVHDGSTLAVEATEARRGQAALVQGAFRSGDASPEGVGLVVEWQGVRLQRSLVKTGGTGEFTAVVQVPPDERLGEIPVRVLFAGSSRLEPVAAVGRAFVRDAVTIALDSLVAWRNQTAVLRGSLVDGRGSPVRGASLNVTWGGIPAAPARTDALGRFEAPRAIPPTARLGSTLVGIDLGRTPAYLEAHAALAVPVMAESVVQASEAVIENGTLAVRGFVADPQGRSLPGGGEVRLRAGGASAPVHVRVPLPAVNLTAARRPVASLDHLYSLGGSQFPAGTARLLASRDGGATWSALEPERGYTPASTRLVDGAPGFAGASPGWAQERLDLGGLAGHTAQVRWRLASGARASDSTWSIDDVSLAAQGDEGPTVLFQEPFTALPALGEGEGRGVWTQQAAPGSRTLQAATVPLLHPDVQGLHAAGQVAAFLPARGAAAASAFLGSGPIPLPADGDVEVAFTQWADLDPQHAGVALEASFDGGAWMPVGAGTREGRSGGWERVVADLTPLRPAGAATLRLRWEVRADPLAADEVAQPPAAAGDLRLEGVAVGGDRFAYGTVQVQAEAANRGPSPARASARLQVRDASGALLAEQALPLDLAPLGQTPVRLAWQPTAPGQYALRLDLLGGDGAALGGADARIAISGLGWFLGDVETVVFHPLRMDDMDSPAWSRQGFNSTPERTLLAAPQAADAVAAWSFVDPDPGNATFLRLRQDFGEPGDASAGDASLALVDHGARSRLAPTLPRLPAGAVWAPRQGASTELFRLPAASGPGRAVEFHLAGGAGAHWALQEAVLGRVEVLDCKEFRDRLAPEPCGAASWHATGAGGPSRWGSGPSRGAGPGLDGSGGAAALGPGPGAAGRNDTLLSPPIRIAPAPGERAELRFWHRLGLGASDQAFVEASVDGGRTWRTLGAWNAPVPGLAHDRFDLSAYAGQAVRLALDLTAQDPPAALEWRVLNLTVAETYPAPAPLQWANGTQLAAAAHAAGASAAVEPLDPLAPDGPRAFVLRVAAVAPLARSAVDGQGRFEVRAAVGVRRTGYLLEYDGIPGQALGDRWSGEASETRVGSRIELAFVGSDGRDRVVVPGRAVLLSGSIADPHGSPAAGARLRLLADAAPLADLVSRANGTLLREFVAPATLPLGSQTWRLEYAGLPAEGRLPTVLDVPVAVKRLARLGARVLPGDGGVDIQGRLADDRGQPLAASTVVASVGQTAHVTLTGEDGTFRIQVPRTGGRLLVLEYQGSEVETPATVHIDLDHLSAAAAPRAPLPWWAWAAIGAAALALAAAAAWLALRRPLPAPQRLGAPPYRLDAAGARAAVIAAYEALARRLDDGGLHALSPQELSRLARQRWGLDAGDLGRLTDLFERSRYGAADLTPRDVEQALAAHARLDAAVLAAQAPKVAP